MNKTDSVYKLIEETPIITIWGHAIPDGDCYGSQIGLRELIKKTWPDKQVYAVGVGIPKLFARLAPMDQVSLETIRQSLAITVDCSCIERVSSPDIRLAKSLVLFDHHLPGNGEGFSGPSYVDSSASSCAELIAFWAQNENLVFDKLSSEALFLGIVSDSGSFAYDGTTARTFEMAAFLFKNGVEQESLLEAFYRSDDKTKNFARYLNRHVKKNGPVAYVYLPRFSYRFHGMTYEKASSMVNVIADATNCPVYCLFTKDSHGDIRGELRGKGIIVQPTAVKYGGGGHAYAAGLTLSKGRPSYHCVIKDLKSVVEEQRHHVGETT